MGQSVTVAFKSLQLEFKRFQRKHSAQKQQEHQSILTASRDISCAVAFEENDNPLVDPPFL